MKILAAFINFFRSLCDDDYDDGYTEYLSEQPGTYINISDVYKNA